jgi:hypothetical protein
MCSPPGALDKAAQVIRSTPLPSRRTRPSLTTSTASLTSSGKRRKRVDVVVQRQPSREGAVALNHAETLRLHFDLNARGPPSLVQ